MFIVLCGWHSKYHFFRFFVDSVAKSLRKFRLRIYLPRDLRTASRLK